MRLHTKNFTSLTTGSKHQTHRNGYGGQHNARAGSQQLQSPSGTARNRKQSRWLLGFSVDSSPPPEIISYTLRHQTDIIPDPNQEPPQYSEFSRLGIKAGDVPQWLWSTAQCRAWLTTVGVTLFNMSIDQAERRANIFEGSDAFIYTLKIDAWEGVWGNVWNGTSVYNMLRANMYQEGAVPSRVYLREEQDVQARSNVR
ncbi:hypothetical protein DL95DRAFT_415023 [Leptodontidium sp. 2 PMI_412]|nr:hypothetical protein DL95DRAFT_415023 [Leptodontidium sp. 2 PMI_412]